MKKLFEKLGLRDSDEDTREINRILKMPRIEKIRRGTGPRIQAATLKVVRNYVKNKKK